MNLLPKSHKDFSDKDYWNKFFKKRGNKAFEWYGEYLELCGHLHKYIKKNDSILVSGCGNSILSADLYDVGFLNITNIDVSEVVIKQMKSINHKRKTMQFLLMDALQMTFDNEQFNVVLDKGTLDALMPDDSGPTVERIDKYFAEIKRVLKTGGRFICITLLQSHILRKLLDSFCDKCWMLRIVRCQEAEEKNAQEGDGTTLPVFVVVATKFVKEMPNLVLEACMAGEKMIRMDTPEELESYVKSVQETAFVTNGLAKTSLDGEDEVSLDLMQPGEDTPRYTLYILDQKRSQGINKYAVFIVPQGRESEWLFGTPAGRHQLQECARFERVVVAMLRRGHVFQSLDSVKDELAHSAKMLAPYGFTGQIPFLSLSSDVGSRVRVHEGSSPVSGAFVVEDVDVNGTTCRRLVFLDNQFLVQSEATLRTVKKKKKTRTIVDYHEISLYHWSMSAAACIGRVPTGTGRVAVLGLGGGGLCMFLKKCFDGINITAVELDPVMVEVATTHFGLELDEQLQVRVMDGEDFLKEEAENGRQYDCVMFDMDSKDRSLGLSCPPPQFLQAPTLALVNTILGEDGQFILNLVCRDTQLLNSIKETLKQHFKHLTSVKLIEEVNEIIVATNGQTAYSKEVIERAGKDLNAASKKIKIGTFKTVDLKDFLKVTIIA